MMLGSGPDCLYTLPMKMSVMDNVKTFGSVHRQSGPLPISQENCNNIYSIDIVTSLEIWVRLPCIHYI